MSETRRRLRRAYVTERVTQDIDYLMNGSVHFSEDKRRELYLLLLLADIAESLQQAVFKDVG